MNCCEAQGPARGSSVDEDDTEHAASRPAAWAYPGTYRHWSGLLDVVATGNGQAAGQRRFTTTPTSRGVTVGVVVRQTSTRLRETENSMLQRTVGDLAFLEDSAAAAASEEEQPSRLSLTSDLQRGLKMSLCQLLSERRRGGSMVVSPQADEILTNTDSDSVESSSYLKVMTEGQWRGFLSLLCSATVKPR